MEYLGIQIFFIVGIILFFCLVVRYLKKNSLSLEYSLLWIFFAISMLIVCIFPNLLYGIMHLLGFALLSNAVFSLIMGFIATIVLSLTSIVSKQSEKIKILVQQNSLLERRMRELEEKKERNNNNTDNSRHVC